MIQRPVQRPVKQLAPGEFIGVTDRRVETRSGIVAFIREQKAVERHEHSDTHIVLVFEGEYLKSARDADGVVCAGHVILNTPGTRHQDQFAGSGRLMTFSIANDVLEQFGERYEASHAARRLLGAASANALKTIGREASDLDETSELEIEGVTYELLASAIGPLRFQTRMPWWLERAREQIIGGLRPASGIVDLARDAGVHPVHLTRAFRKFFGQSPGVMSRRVRMKKAASLLARTSAPICDIALECGFSDQAAFTKAFRRAAAVSPLAFRRRWKR
jgi:AraC family transcriptional regulator